MVTVLRLGKPPLSVLPILLFERERERESEREREREGTESKVDSAATGETDFHITTFPCYYLCVCVCEREIKQKRERKCEIARERVCVCERERASKETSAATGETVTLHYTVWRKPIGCLIFISNFPQKSSTISGSFAKHDLQFKASSTTGSSCSSCERLLLQNPPN